MDANVIVSNTIWDMLGAVSMAITATVIAVGFYYARRQLASTRNARIAQVVLDLAARWDNKEMEEGRCRLSQHDDANKIHAAINEANGSNTSDLCVLMRVANFFDALGAMVVEGFVDCSIAYDVFGQAEDHYYKLYTKTLEDPAHRDYLRCFRDLHKAFDKETEKRKKRTSSRWPPRRP